MNTYELDSSESWASALSRAVHRDNPLVEGKLGNYFYPTENLWRPTYNQLERRVKSILKEVTYA
jgi:hypothetical protein